VEPEPRVAHVDVAVAAARGAVFAPHVLGEDAPRLDAARDVDAHVALQRRADVVPPHRRRHAHGGGLVPAPGVERSGDLPLLVQDVPALLDRTGDEHVAVHPEEVLAVAPRLLPLLQGLARLGLAYCHVDTSLPGRRTAWTLPVDPAGGRARGGGGGSGFSHPRGAAGAVGGRGGG